MKAAFPGYVQAFVLLLLAAFRPQHSGEPGASVVKHGTGGKNLKSFWRKQANSLVPNGKLFGVLELELRERSYTWSFIAEGGQVLDCGTDQCHSKRQLGSPKEGAL
jgi:hypothetical protein